MKQMTQFEKAREQKEIACDICGKPMWIVPGGGWDNDRIYCSDVRECGAEIVYPTSTEVSEQLGENKNPNTIPDYFFENGGVTDYTLNVIRQWPADDWVGLIEFLQYVWDHTYGNMVFSATEVDFITGGWSENEAILSALRENYAIHSMYWISSHRGGRSVYARNNTTQ